MIRTLHPMPAISGRYRFLILSLLVMMWIVGGCRTATGTWQTVSTDPPGLPFPVHELTLDESGGYRAKSQIEGKTIHSAGAYRWDGRWLKVQQEGYEPRSYRLTRRRDGTLVMTYEVDGGKISAIMERASEREEAPPPPAPDQRPTP